MPPHNPHKPMNLLDTRGLRQERTAVVDALHECMKLAELDKPLPVRDFGQYRHPGWRDEEGELQPHLSVDWYISAAWDMAKEKLSGAQLLEILEEEPWRREEFLGDHYDVWLVDQELFDKENLDADESVAGMSLRSVGMVLSVRPFDEVELPTYSLLKTAALHELGHLFGLPGMHGSNVTFESGFHCAHRCAMQHAGASPWRWLELTEQRLAHGPYCDECVAKLRAHFHGDEAP